MSWPLDSATIRVHTANSVKNVSCIVTPSGTGVSGEDHFVLDDVKGAVTHDDEITIDVASGGGGLWMDILSVSCTTDDGLTTGG